MRPTVLTMAAAALMSLAVATTAQAIPLRELIAQEMDKQHPGVLTQAEIKSARVLGAHWYHRYPMGMPDLDARAKSVAHRSFPHSGAKQREYALEIGIGYLMAAESALWNPE